MTSALPMKLLKKAWMRSLVWQMIHINLIYRLQTEYKVHQRLMFLLRANRFNGEFVL